MGVRTAPMALALRRAVIAVLCLGVTLGAHTLSAGGHDVGPVSLVAAGTIALAAMLIGPRSAPFRPRGAVTGLALVVVVQALAHVAMSAAPWAFGLTAHHPGPLVTPGAVAVHGVAAVVVALLVFGLERILAATLAAVGAVRRWLGTALAGSPPRVAAPAALARTAAASPAGARGARAPPAIRI